MNLTSKLLSFFCLLMFAQITQSAEALIERIDPPFWWVGMNNPEVELMVYGENISQYEVKIDHNGVVLQNALRVENPNYVFLDIRIERFAKPGLVDINFRNDSETHTFQYELKVRETSGDRIQGLDQSDLIYLLMPDRFANGDLSNDIIAGTKDSTIDRNHILMRHGGDLQGVINHLDYLQDLGVTALWMNPVLENDQPKESYHGYACTDMYKVDPRLGTNELYKQLVDKAESRGIKSIMDIIHNHVGNEHWFLKDPPSGSWIHEHDEFTKTTYRATTIMDPYASQYDLNLMKNGWFDHHMPDLNQDHPLLGKYLIQNNIWWIEYLGLDGLRLDTYAYSDEAFLMQWIEAIQAEYPNIGIFGELWVQGETVQAYFHGNTIMDTEFNSGLPSVTDFQLHYAIKDAMTEDFGWTEGLMRLYYTLAADYLYRDAGDNILFLDNHDKARFFAEIKQDFAKWKMAAAFLMTTRRIPSIYYGTEILMSKGGTRMDDVRHDFPGGWPGDLTNKFKRNGRTPLEEEAFNYIKTLANWRKVNPAVTSGALMQFVPIQGIYTYFRYTDNETVMVMMNSNNEGVIMNTDRYNERIGNFTKGIDVVTGKMVEFPVIKIPAKTAYILELK